MWHSHVPSFLAPTRSSVFRTASPSTSSPTRHVLFFISHSLSSIHTQILIYFYLLNKKNRQVEPIAFKRRLATLSQVAIGPLF